MASVKIQLSHRKNRFRPCTEPEVHQIEMVGRFMHQQTAAVVLVAVPAPVIIRAVARIQKPLEVYGKHVADYTVHQQLPHLCVAGGIPVVESHTQFFARALLRVKNRLRLFLVDCHGFFRNHVTALFHRADDIVMVRSVNRRHNDSIRLSLINHALKLGIIVHGNRLRSQFLFECTVRKFHARFAQIAERNHFGCFFICSADRLVIHPRSAAQTYLCILCFFHIAHLFHSKADFESLLSGALRLCAHQ